MDHQVGIESVNDDINVSAGRVKGAGGRPNHHDWTGFTRVLANNGRFRAKCVDCGVEVANTAIKRLQQHRNRCKRKANNDDLEVIYKEEPEYVYETEYIIEETETSTTTATNRWPGYTKMPCINGRSKAKCNSCGMEFANTAFKRLKAHKMKCLHSNPFEEELLEMSSNDLARGTWPGYSKVLNDNGKYKAKCDDCGFELTNTAKARLKVHKDHCYNQIPCEGDEQPSSDSGYKVSPRGSWPGFSKALSSEGKLRAKCDSCGKEIANTSRARLQAHKDTCTHIKPEPDEESEEDEHIEEETAPPTPKKRLLNTGITQYIDQNTAGEQNEYAIKLAQCFYKLKIPFQHVEDESFIEFFRDIRPSFVLPTRKELENDLLDAAYENELQSNSEKIANKENGVLFIEGWNSSCSEAKTVVAMIASDEKNILLESYDIPAGKFEDVLEDVVSDAKEKAKSLYDVELKVVVTDNYLVKTGRQLGLFYSNCHAQQANLYLKDLVKHCRVIETLNSITPVLKVFQKPEIAVELKMLGGKTLLPKKKCFVSYRDALENYLNNLKLFKILVDPLSLSSSINDIVFSADVESDCTLALDTLNPGSELLNKCRQKSTKLSDIVEMWTELVSQTTEPTLAEILQDRIVGSNVFNANALSANLLDPNYMGRSLTTAQRSEAEDYLMELLKDDQEAIQALSKYVQLEGRFKTLRQSLEPRLYWSFGKSESAGLAELAQQFALIPASTSQSNGFEGDEVFENSLSKEKSEKLNYLHENYRLNIGLRNNE